MFLSDVYNTQAIAAYFTEAQSNKMKFMLEAYFPNRKLMGIDLKWLKIHKGLGVALKPSNLDALPPVRPRGQAQMTKEQMPIYRESMVVKEHDLMEISRVADANDPFLQPVIDSLYDDVAALVNGAEISAEWLRSQLFAPINGDMKITIGMTNDTIYTYDYDPDGTWKRTNYLELTGSDTWDNATSKPLNDIRKATQYLASVGVTATTMIGNSATFDYLLENEQVKSALTNGTNQTISFVDESTVEDVLKRRMRLEWIPYDKMFEDYDGTQKKFYPDDYVTILGSGQLGNTWRGTTPEELTTIGNFMDIPQAPVDITVLESGIAVAIQNEYKPSFTVTTTASQIVLPSFEGMDTIFVIKVK